MNVANFLIDKLRMFLHLRKFKSAKLHKIRINVEKYIKYLDRSLFCDI